jgi:hypothetical protein
MLPDLRPKLPTRLSELIAAASALSPVGASIPSVQYLSGDSRTIIYESLASGRLLAIKRGRRTFVTWESLTEYLASLPPAVFGNPDGQKGKSLGSTDLPPQGGPPLDCASDAGERSDA